MQKYNSRFLSSFSVKLLAVGLSFLSTILITKITSIEVSGKFFFLQSIIVPLSVVMRLGFEHRIVREISARDFSKARISFFSWGIIKKVIFMYLILFFICIAVTKFQYIYITTLALCTSLFISTSMLFGFFFQAKRNIILMHLLQGFITNSLFCVFLLYSFMFDKSYSENFLLFIFSLSWLMSILLGYFLWIKISSVNFNDDLKIILSIKENLNVISVNFLNQCIQWGIPFMLGISLLEAQVAEYVVAYKIAMLFSILLISVNSYIMPKIALCISEENTYDLEVLVKKVTCRLSLLACPVLFLLIFFAPYFTFFLGDEYLSSVNMFRILCVAQLINVVSGSVGVILNMANLEKNVLTSSFISVLFLTLSCLVLVPIYGGNGAAISQVVSVFVQMAVLSYYVKKNFGFIPLFFFNLKKRGNKK
jgi:O-antigen/teichoic acid export membrane protein